MNAYACALWDAAITLENDGDFYKEYTGTAPSKASDRRTLIEKAVQRILGNAKFSGIKDTRTRATPWTWGLEHLRLYLDSTWDMAPANPGTPGMFNGWTEIKFWDSDVRHPPAPTVPEPPATPAPAKDWKQELIDARAAGKTLQYRNNDGEWKDEKSWGRYKFLSPQDRYRVKPDEPSSPSTPTIAGDMPVNGTVTATTSTSKETTMNNAIIAITTKTLINGTDIASFTDSQVYDLIAAQEAEIKKLEAIETKPKRLVAEIEKRKAGIAALVAHLDSKDDAK